jgi:hypothetical protein
MADIPIPDRLLFVVEDLICHTGEVVAEVAVEWVADEMIQEVEAIGIKTRHHFHHHLMPGFPICLECLITDLLKDADLQIRCILIVGYHLVII